MTNVGPGKSDDYVRADIAYPNVPAMRVQTNYLRVGGIAQIDYRDQQAGARSGGNYVARFDNFDDLEARGYTFRRLDLEAQQFIPLFNKRRVIAVRARSLQTFASSGQQVPFYQQAVLGGDDLRGFRPYRFYDNNMMVFNAEYRWEIFSGLDGAVFADAGQVSKRRWEVNLDSIETAVGFGLRFNVRNAPFLRVDVGFSHEGFQVFLKFKEVWAQRPRSTSSAPHIF
jgi:outer membrane protein assembly factor BamA